MSQHITAHSKPKIPDEVSSGSQILSWCHTASPCFRSISLEDFVLVWDSIKCCNMKPIVSHWHDQRFPSILLYNFALSSKVQYTQLSHCSVIALGFAGTVLARINACLGGRGKSLELPKNSFLQQVNSYRNCSSGTNLHSERLAAWQFSSMWSCCWFAYSKSVFLAVWERGMMRQKLWSVPLGSCNIWISTIAPHMQDPLWTLLWDSDGKECESS